MRSLLVYLIALAIAVVGVGIGFPELWKEPTAAEDVFSLPPAAPPVIVAAAARSPFVAPLIALGTVRANESVAITPNRPEHIAALHFEDGQEVAGDPDLGQCGRRGMKAEVVDAVVEQGGVMSKRQALRHRVRYFCDGAVLGTAAFVNEVFEREQALRKRFGEKRTTGARRMRGADWGELRVLRDLQKDVIGT